MSIKARRKTQKDAVRKTDRKIKKDIAVCKSEMITVSLGLALRHKILNGSGMKGASISSRGLAQGLQVHRYRDHARCDLRATPFHQSVFRSE